MEHLKRFLRKVNTILETGFRRQTYTELYTSGAITQEEYLKLMEKEDSEACNL